MSDNAHIALKTPDSIKLLYIKQLYAKSKYKSVTY